MSSPQSPIPNEAPSLAERLASARAWARVVADARHLLPSARVSPTSFLESRAARTPRSPVLLYESRRYGYGEVDELANRWGHVLAADGVGPGDTVALVMDNRPEFLFALHGASKLGAVAALINTNLSGAPLAHAIRVSGARRVVAGSEHAAKVADAMNEVDELSRDKDLLVEQEKPEEDCSAYRVLNEDVAAAPTTAPGDPIAPHPDETFCYIYTSGTTGLPKAAIIANKRITLAGVGFGHLMHRVSPGEVIYVPLPLYHSSAMFLGWSAALATGAAIALRRKFSASNFWSDVRGYGASSFLYIGELCRYLLNTPVQEGERDHRLRVAVGNGLRPDIWQEFQERFGVPKVREFYGATEGNVAALNLSGRPGMIGKATPGQAILRCDATSGEPVRGEDGFCENAQVGETGLLVGRISKVTSFDGYVDRSATEKKILHDVKKEGDRWFNSGDLVQLHEGRWLSFADRVGDTFRWKGENVSTNEVAEVLNGAPGVLESNVYGVRVPRADGRCGMAALTIDTDFDIEAFGEFVAQELPGYQRPLFVRLLESDMQVTGTFKHQKVDYRDEAFDPAKVKDALFVMDTGRYRALDADVHAKIEAGEITPG